MRITIGHVLVSGGAGFIIFQLYFNPAQANLNAKASNGLMAEIQSWVSLFQTGESSSINKVEEPATNSGKSLIPESNQAEVNKSIPVNPAVTTPEVLSKTEEIPVAVAPIAPITPIVAPIASPVPAVVAHSRANRKVLPGRKRIVPPAQLSQKREKRLAVAATSQLSIDQMVGSYVSVELVTGKKVLGILQEKNAKEVKIQLPGMGPFSYPAENVKSIQPAE